MTLVYMQTFLVVLASCVLSIVAVTPDVSAFLTSDVLCESCKAIVHEAEAHIGKKPRTEASVSAALKNICSDQRMKSFEANLPVILMLGCRKVVETYSAVERSAMEARAGLAPNPNGIPALEASILSNPAPDGYKNVCAKSCSDHPDLLNKPAVKMDNTNLKKDKEKLPQAVPESPLAKPTLKPQSRGSQMTTKIGDGKEETEDLKSVAIPDRGELRCDACSLIMQSLAGALAHAESLRDRPLTESQIYATLEYICKPGLSDYGVYTNIPGPDGSDTTRFQVPGQWPTGPNFQMKMSSYGTKYKNRLVTGCRQILEKIGEEEFYELYQKHVPAPAKGRKKNDVDVNATFAPTEAFLRAVCVKSGGDEEQVPEETKSKKKKRKATKSSQDVRNECDADQFFFSLEGWQMVVAKTKKNVGKVEL